MIDFLHQLQSTTNEKLEKLLFRIDCLEKILTNSLPSSAAGHLKKHIDFFTVQVNPFLGKLPLDSWEQLTAFETLLSAKELVQIRFVAFLAYQYKSEKTPALFVKAAIQFFFQRNFATMFNGKIGAGMKDAG